MLGWLWTFGKYIYKILKRKEEKLQSQLDLIQEAILQIQKLQQEQQQQITTLKDQIQKMGHDQPLCQPQHVRLKPHVVQPGQSMLGYQA